MDVSLNKTIEEAKTRGVSFIQDKPYMEFILGKDLDLLYSQAMEYKIMGRRAMAVYTRGGGSFLHRESADRSFGIMSVILTYIEEVDPEFAKQMREKQ